MRYQLDAILGEEFTLPVRFQAPGTRCLTLGHDAFRVAFPTTAASRPRPHVGIASLHCGDPHRLQFETHAVVMPMMGEERFRAGILAASVREDKD
jgi:hypothetical protein